MEARTAQGAVAWALALIAFPYIALPLFWIFGRSKFEGYVIARRSDLSEASPIAKKAYAALAERDLLVRTDHARELPFERLAKLPFTTGNDAELLIDGDATFASIFAGIERAHDYILVQFYILRDDAIGRALQDRLLERVRAGVRVYVLYDEIGSHDLSSGPADELESCTLFCIAAINAATSRLWIASPYFVPDEQFITALQLAALRGVDVRILFPKKSDNLLVSLSVWSYLGDVEKVGIEVYQYTRGFMHQKVTLIDDTACTIGTANFDNRSFRLHFEITMAISDPEIAAQVQAMLETDFANAERITTSDLRARSFAFRLATRAARLAAPVQ